MHEHVLAPDESFGHEYTSGMTQTAQDVAAEITSNTIGADGGLQFKKFSLGLSEQYTKQLATIKSNSTEQLQEETYKYTIINNKGFNIGWTKYILCSEYHIERADGTRVGSPWTVEDKTTTHSVYYPNGVTFNEVVEKV